IAWFLFVAALLIVVVLFVLGLSNFRKEACSGGGCCACRRIHEEIPEPRPRGLAAATAAPVRAARPRPRRGRAPAAAGAGPATFRGPLAPGGVVAGGLPAQVRARGAGGVPGRRRRGLRRQPVLPGRGRAPHRRGRRGGAGARRARLAAGPCRGPARARLGAVRLAPPLGAGGGPGIPVGPGRRAGPGPPVDPVAAAAGGPPAAGLAGRQGAGTGLSGRGTGVRRRRTR